MSGLKITGCSVGMLEALERVQEAVGPKIKSLNDTLDYLAEVRKAKKGSTLYLSFGDYRIDVDSEFVCAFEEVLLGLYLRKEQELAAFEWEIPLAASKAQEPDNGEHPDLYV